MVSSTPQPHFTPGKDPVPILQEAGRAPGPVWTGIKSLPHRDSIPDRRAHSSVTVPTELPDNKKSSSQKLRETDETRGTYRMLTMGVQLCEVLLVMPEFVTTVLLTFNDFCGVTFVEAVIPDVSKALFFETAGQNPLKNKMLHPRRHECKRCSLLQTASKILVYYY